MNDYWNDPPDEMVNVCPDCDVPAIPIRVFRCGSVWKCCECGREFFLQHEDPQEIQAQMDEYFEDMKRADEYIRASRN